MNKKITFLIIFSLKEALCSVYWYKNDLRKFLSKSIDDEFIIDNTDWNKSKRQIASDVIDYYCSDKNGIKILKVIFLELCKVTDFSHLKHLENGDELIKKAELSISQLKSIAINMIELTIDE